MGADLITTMVVCKQNTELDWENGKKAIADLTVEQVDLNWLENFVYDIDLDEDDNVNMGVIRERVGYALDNLQNHIDGLSRALNTWTMWGHTLFIFGEMSWGDTDEIFDDIGILDVCDSVLEAVGFVTDFSGTIGPNPNAVEVASAEYLP